MISHATVSGGSCLPDCNVIRLLLPLSPDRRWVSEDVCKCALGSRPGLSSHLQGDPLATHSFILSRGGNNRWEPESELCKSTSERSYLRAPWDNVPKRWFLGLEALEMGWTQGHNSIEWPGNHTPTFPPATLMNKLLTRDDGNEPERWRMSALHAVHVWPDSSFNILLAKEPVSFFLYPTSCIPAVHSRRTRRRCPS